MSEDGDSNSIMLFNGTGNGLSKGNASIAVNGLSKHTNDAAVTQVQYQPFWQVVSRSDSQFAVNE